MKQDFKGWDTVSDRLIELANAPDIDSWKLNEGQRVSLHAVAARLPKNGVLIADEVGMGKTRIAVAVALSVIAAGGRVAILVPPGLGYQWREELQQGGVDSPIILRSFLQYLQAWEAEEEHNQKPWFKEKVVLFSHAFTNWRLGENSAPWRWTLLPELYAQWRNQKEVRVPRKFRDEWVKRAAKSICATITNCTLPAHKIICDLTAKIPWPGALKAARYGRYEDLRPLLERAIGLGLGIFDLVIIDEAHKSRGQDSMLSSLLDGVVLTNGASSRRFAMTATPVELDASQWQQTLKRLGVDSRLFNGAIDGYTDSVKNVRQTPSNEQIREAFKHSARKFQDTLSPYLIRRDKREDPHVQKFARLAQRPLHEYRKESEIIVDTSKLPPKWQHSVCAAESLSIVAQQADDPVAKRLRLTLGNGHGIAALLDQVKRDSETGKQQEEGDGSNSPEQDEDTNFPADKRQQRAQWWRDVMCRAFEMHSQPESALYWHPAILAAVEAIEYTCRLGEKVLVFGRFTLPLQALVNLLNAREMLRCLDVNQFWPQEKVHAGEWEAIQAAHRQLKRDGEVDQAILNQKLSRQYRELEKLREKYRNNLIENLENGLKEQGCIGSAKELFKAFRVSVVEGQLTGHGGALLAFIAKAMLEFTGLDPENVKPVDYADAFIDLINASCDHNEGDTDDNGTLDEKEATNLWKTLEQRLREEHNRPQGGFARLMYGGTKPETRRLLQAAFNRQNCYPKVLVAQSMVGREGLNLHKACRTVVLLHPEWNPGVVEQQIGRVDRVGSLWERLLDMAEDNGISVTDLPRIHVRPVIFKGTYDEKNWQVLRKRWDDLRAQLHGVVIAPSTATKYGNVGFVSEINNSAPNFSPQISEIDRNRY